MTQDSEGEGYGSLISWRAGSKELWSRFCRRSLRSDKECIHAVQATMWQLWSSFLSFYLSVSFLPATFASPALQESPLMLLGKARKVYGRTGAMGAYDRITYVARRLEHCDMRTLCLFRFISETFCLSLHDRRHVSNFGNKKSIVVMCVFMLI